MIAAIDAALVAQNKSRADLGRKLGIDSSQVTRLFKGRRKLQAHEYLIAAEWLQLATPPATTGGRVVAMPGLIPLFGWSNPATSTQLSLTEDMARGYVPMHPNQANTKDAFALEIGLIDMSPRYELGEIAYLAPNRWPSRGQDLLVITTDGEGIIRRFVRRDATSLVIERLSPSGEETLPIAAVAQVHAIVGRG